MGFDLDLEGGAFMRRRAMRYGFGRDFEGGHIIIRFGFEWDLSGISREDIL